MPFERFIYCFTISFGLILSAYLYRRFIKRPDNYQGVEPYTDYTAWRDIYNINQN